MRGQEQTWDWCPWPRATLSPTFTQGVFGAPPWVTGIETVFVEGLTAFSFISSVSSLNSGGWIPPLNVLVFMVAL